MSPGLAVLGSSEKGVLGQDLTPANCNDINADGQWWNEAHTDPDSTGVHSHCEFPVNDIVNPFDTTHFTSADVKWEEQYLDVHVKNPDARIFGYQLEFDGLQITQTESLFDPTYGFTGSPSHAPSGSQVMAVSYDGTTVPKHTVYVPLLRVHWVGSANGMVCLEGYTEVVNDFLQKTLIDLDNPCQEQSTQACPGDMDGDGATNVTDVLAVLSACGTACN